MGFWPSGVSSMLKPKDDISLRSLSESFFSLSSARHNNNNNLNPSLNYNQNNFHLPSITLMKFTTTTPRSWCNRGKQVKNKMVHIFVTKTILILVTMPFLF